MNRKRKTGEAVAYLLALVARPLLLPVIAPVMIWTNVRGYSYEDSSTLGIQSGDGVVSILTAFANVVIFPVTVRRNKLFSSSGGTVLGSLSLGADGDGSATGATSEPTSPPNEILTLPLVEKETKETDLNNEIQER